MSSARAVCSSLALQLEMTQIELLTSDDATEEKAKRLIRLQAKEAILSAQYEVFRHARVLCEYKCNTKKADWDPAKIDELDTKHMQAVAELYAAAEKCPFALVVTLTKNCLLYTSDAADDLLCVDLGGRRILKKKKKEHRHREY
eukprot:TRINITY_DN10307_c0_g1_i1.p2 TRINITY_DN10307_c0_g1~~TRINITY_DN10307_c0_g1_i1.p2  ORF type:complete len:144 (-),score=74.25 TRINITY_DN10307_c0_g1_i1:81-512(-)